MVDRTGNAYERLTRRLMQELGETQAVQTVELVRRKRLRGRTTTHEIDVWWVFDWLGLRYSVAFQCKDWARPVEQGELLKFHAVLQDLAAYSPTEVFVTKQGYQRGSIDVAQGNGISVMELRVPHEDDWAGRVSRIYITCRAVVPAWRNYSIQVPDTVGPEVPGSLAGWNESIVIEEPGKEPRSILQLQEQLVPGGYEATHWQPFVISFRNGTWLRATEDPATRVPVSGLSVEARLEVVETAISVSGTEVVAHVLKNTLTQVTVLFGPNGQPRQASDGLRVLDLKPQSPP